MVEHNGFRFSCDVRAFGNECEPFSTHAMTERTAIEHARGADWFVGVIRITKGMPKSKVHSVRIVLCPMCRSVVGA